MTYEELESLVRAGEGEWLEFKRSTAEMDNALRSVCAFFNGGDGGVVLFGVSDDGQILGQNATDETLKKLANSLRNRIDPPQQVRIESVPISEGKAVIVLQVEASSRICYLDGQPYERVASTTRKMDVAIHEKRESSNMPMSAIDGKRDRPFQSALTILILVKW